MITSFRGIKSMDDIARYDRQARIIAEAAQYRTLREVVKSDPQISPHTAALLRRAFDVEGDPLSIDLWSSSVVSS
jgi:hypothetical protein